MLFRSRCEDTWFTDVVNQYFVKGGARSQRSSLRDVYEPFAAIVDELNEAHLPARPSPGALVKLAVRAHASRLCAEVAQARPTIVVTLGEEARQVLARIADVADGPPTVPLTDPTALADVYGRPGTIAFGEQRARWYAAVQIGRAHV